MSCSISILKDIRREIRIEADKVEEERLRIKRNEWLWDERGGR